MMPKVVILSDGQRFGKWTLVALAPMHVACSGRPIEKALSTPLDKRYSHPCVG